MKKNLLLLLATIFFAIGCTHDKTEIGGTGGSATVVVYPQHHTVAKNLDSFKVYVKYNAQDAPANGAYDDSATCTRQDSVILTSFPGLRNGKYYFYGRGYDTSIHQYVKGGSPYTISAQQSQVFDLAVSEE